MRLVTGIKITVDNSISSFREDTTKAIRKVVASNLNEACERAQDYAVKSTGAMAAGMYVVHPDSEKSYQNAVTSALLLNPEAQMHGEIYPSDNDDGLGGVITGAVQYTEVVEFGTGRGANSKPRPAIGPAVEEQDPIFVQQLNEAIAKVIKNGPSKRTKRRI